ncbi:glucosamine-6-phosphate deaminase [Georgenia halophila]|uniref:Glucosamine-6-phosphate deaminase n=1 Tax=Georgenia halophila TaxID=620889 RepID=A0ABP8LKQ7_9MICO
MSRTTDRLLAGGTTVARTADEVGRHAADRVSRLVLEAISARGRARVIFASAPSQEPTIAALRSDVRIDWSRVQAFHMDEYLGLPFDHPQAFGQWLQDRLPTDVTLRRIDPTADPAAEASRYAQLLSAAPIDVTCLGIGVNGHIAFNEPDVADFDDPELVRTVELDEVSRTQQVDEGLFAAVADVPTRALTLTVPALVGARSMVATVLGSQKAAAVSCALTGPVTARCPASVLRTHGAASIHLDEGAASLLGDAAAVDAAAVDAAAVDAAAAAVERAAGVPIETGADDRS